MASLKKKTSKATQDKRTLSSSKIRTPKGAWWQNKKVQWSLAAILLMTFVAYIPALSGEFNNWDDQLYVTDSKLIQDLSPSGLANIIQHTSSGKLPSFDDAELGD